MGVRLFACWDCRFESRRGHEFLTLVSVVGCQVEVSAKGRSLVQRNPTECVCMCVCVRARARARTRLIVIVERHRGGLGPLALTKREEKKILSCYT